VSFGDVSDEDLRLGGGKSIAHTRKWKLIINVAIRSWDVDNVCVWHVGLLRLLPFLRLRRSTRVTLFLHGIEIWRKLDPSLQRLLKRVDLFLANSEFTWRRFVEFNSGMSGRPHQVVHLGLGEALSTQTPKPRHPAALMLGRLERTEFYKGHWELISSWPAVAAAVPDAQLWIAGEGDSRQGLQRHSASLGLGESVRFFGRVSEEHKQQLLQECQCFALPSQGEGFGLVYLEAMRMSRPCLVSNRDAGREVVNPPEAGTEVNPHDSGRLASALIEMFTNSNRWQEQSAAARGRYETKFTAAHFQRRLIDALYGEEATR
jgi:phosphatidylinositol alpha-1,6-mannosyltransferase